MSSSHTSQERKNNTIRFDRRRKYDRSGCRAWARG